MPPGTVLSDGLAGFTFTCSLLALMSLAALLLLSPL